VHWKQRAKVEWLRHGDRNTNFYHAYANPKKKKKKSNFMEFVDGMPKIRLVMLLSNIFPPYSSQKLEEICQSVLMLLMGV
jgi:hypothetical protein